MYQTQTQTQTIWEFGFVRMSLSLGLSIEFEFGFGFGFGNEFEFGVWAWSNEFGFGFGFVQVPKLPNSLGLSLGLDQIIKLYQQFMFKFVLHIYLYVTCKSFSVCFYIQKKVFCIYIWQLKKDPKPNSNPNCL
jgi:hypothetical protein